MRPFLLIVSLLLTACGSKPEPPPEPKAAKPPRITHFYGNAATVAPGETLTLCYGTENADAVTLKPLPDSEVRPTLNRCVADKPKENTVYTLRVSGPGGSVSETFKVTIGKSSAAAPPAASRELIRSFNVLGNSKGPGSPVQLCYSAAGAATVSVSPSAGVRLSPGENQCFVVKPEKTATYVLTATASDGAVDRMQVTVPVQ